MNANDGQHPTRPVDAETAAESGDATGVEPDRLGLFARIGNGLLWLVGHAPKILPVVVIGLIAALSWNALRAIHPRDVRVAFPRARLRSG